MSQKTEEIESVFNPSNFGVFYYNTLEIESADKKKKESENKIYEEVRNGLKSDLVNLGFELTYSSEILVNEVAFNIVSMNRLKTEIICRNPLRKKEVIRPDRIHTKKDLENPKESFKSVFYDIKILEEDEIHPLFDRLIPKLQKQIHEGIKDLGLLPVQQIERQKLVIVKKLRQKYEGLVGEVSVKSRQEKTNFSKKKEPLKEEAVIESV